MCYMGLSHALQRCQASEHHMVERLTPGKATLEYLNLLKSTIEQHPKSTINRDPRMLCDVFFDVFDLRRIRYEDHLVELYTEAQIVFLEEAAIETFVALILKINDAVFRPILVRLIDWSAALLPKQDVLGKTLRSTTLYNFLGALSDRLKVSFSC